MCTEGEFFLWYSRCTKRRGGECNPRRLPPEALERIPEGGRSGAGGRGARGRSDEIEIGDEGSGIPECVGGANSPEPVEPVRDNRR